MTSFRDGFVEVAGIRMHVCHTSEERSRRPVMVLHGFTGCVESMEGVVRRLAVDRSVLALDLVGHGKTDAPDDLDHYSMSACVDQVAAALEAVDVPVVHVLGYSMGARVALSLAVAHPAKVASLVLVGASPGLADGDARAARVEADRALARRIEVEGLERFVDYWMSLPLFASQASLGKEFLAASRAQRLRCNVTGLSGSLRGMGTGCMPALHDRLHEIEKPICLVAGSCDAKFVVLAEQMCRRLRDGRCALIEGVGHAAHLEDPAPFARIARTFLSEIEDRQEMQP